MFLTKRKRGWVCCASLALLASFIAAGGSVRRAQGQEGPGGPYIGKNSECYPFQCSTWNHDITISNCFGNCDFTADDAWYDHCSAPSTQSCTMPGGANQGGCHGVCSTNIFMTCNETPRPTCTYP